MSTRMDEEDWAHTLKVFRASLLRRGRKGANDRLFLEALHFFTVENVRWRALPERFGRWNTVWKRFDRLSKAGVFEAFFETLAALSPSAPLIQMFDSTIVRATIVRATIVRACLGGGGKRGQKRQALGRSRGGFTTKIHAKSDRSGDIIAFDLTGGERSDTTHFQTLLDIGPDIAPCAAIADKGYSSKTNRAAARPRGIAPVIPPQGQQEEQAGLFRQSPRQGPGAHRARLRSSQTLQARRLEMRENSQKFPIQRQIRSRSMLDQIRPHGLADYSLLQIRLSLGPC